MFQKASLKGRASVSEVSIIGIDLAKRVFQLHGACANGADIFRKQLTRVQLLAFMSEQPKCTVAMEHTHMTHMPPFYMIFQLLGIARPSRCQKN